ncbi:hypothetical protein KP509_1Z260300 [Ceratopteris richardii]|nr:hypothetical protein KP509_1Z260300 [Ceratopteris richardii]
MVGKLSPVIMKFSGEAVLQQAFQRVSAFGSLYRRSEAQEESLGFSVTLVEAVADIIETLGVADNYIITTITEAVGHIYFNFPNLFPKQKPTIYQTLQKLFKNLEKHGSIFSVFMNNIVWSSLERAMEPSTEENAITVELWQNYVELWSNLVDFDSATCYKKEECTSKDSIDEGRYVRIKEGIFDAMIVCGIKALQELNLKYRVKPVTTDKEIPEGEGTLNPDSDINPIEPLNARDMKKFLNLVEFLQGFLSSHSVPYCPKWILPFMRSLIELSSSYPLLSGFYKLLTVMMKIADDHGYFETVASSTLMSHDTSMYCQLDTEHRQEQHVHEDSLVCGDLLQHFLQEVVVSSKRYKLELLASCLRLCLSAPPSLMDLKSKIDPLKI